VNLQERRDRLEQNKQVEQHLQHRKCIEELFHQWDSNLAGFIDLNDFVNTFIKWKGFEDQETMNQGGLAGGGVIELVCTYKTCTMLTLQNSLVLYSTARLIY